MPRFLPLPKRGGCYAEHGPLNILWSQISNGTKGMNFDNFLSEVRQLPQGLWRYGQAGDLPGDGDQIQEDQLLALAKANRHRPVIAYTHKPLTEQNMNSITKANERGFHINISCESFNEADRITSLGYSAVIALPSEYQRGKNEQLSEYKARLSKLRTKTEAGTRVAICPATYTETNCQQCGVCAKPRPNKGIIGFPAHGTKTATVNQRLSNASSDDGTRNVFGHRT